MQTWYGRKYHGWGPWLEQRVDQVLVRSGLAPTIQAARQRINHDLVSVNHAIVTSPSQVMQPGDVLTVAPLRKIERQLPEALRNHAEEHLWLKYMWTSLMDPLAIRTHSVLRSIFPGIHSTLSADRQDPSESPESVSYPGGAGSHSGAEITTRSQQQQQQQPRNPRQNNNKQHRAK